MRPIVGITAYAEEATWGVWTLPAALIPLSYVRSVERAGGRALLVPPIEGGVEETLDRLGLLFSGGSDVDPDLYGAEAHPTTLGTRPERDRAELALLTAALERDMPVLAVCRGSQVLNVALGGDLEQHVPERVGHDGHKEVAGMDLHVAEGEIYGFLGPNGAGKSTTVHMLTTLLPPTAGHATVAGFDVVHEGPKVRKAIGAALQEAALDPILTGREHMRLQTALHALPREERVPRGGELLARLGLTAAADRKVRTCAGGMTRLLDLALAL